MELLLEYGANITLKHHDSATTLHFGVKSVACTKLAIDRGIFPSSQDSLGRTALTYAALINNSSEMVRSTSIYASALSIVVRRMG